MSVRTCFSVRPPYSPLSPKGPSIAAKICNPPQEPVRSPHRGAEFLVVYKEQKLKQEIAALSKIKSNPSYFYTYAKKSSKGPNQVGTLVRKDKQLCENDFEKSECLREQYETVFTQPKDEFIINYPNLFFNIQKTESKCQDCDEERTHKCINYAIPVDDERQAPAVVGRAGHPAWPCWEQEEQVDKCLQVLI